MDKLFGSPEQARNAALDYLEEQGAEFDGQVKPVHQKWGAAAGREVGVEGEGGGSWWRIRHDYDPDTGPHYNAEYGKGGSNKHFGYPGDEDTYERNTRRPKNR